jgi:hypothetical protein
VNLKRYDIKCLAFVLGLGGTTMSEFKFSAEALRCLSAQPALLKVPFLVVDTRNASVVPVGLRGPSLERAQKRLEAFVRETRAGTTGSLPLRFPIADLGFLQVAENPLLPKK